MNVRLWDVRLAMGRPNTPSPNNNTYCDKEIEAYFLEACTYLRERCTSDYLWDKMLERKWSKLIRHVARQEWNRHVESRKRENLLVQHNDHSGSLGSVKGVWPSLYLGSYLEYGSQSRSSSRMISDDSVMALYISLETGRLWFPAQAYTRGGLILCCYDVLLSYDSQTNTFRSRYRHDGWRKIEESIPWERVRASTAENPPNVIQCYDCLNELAPGDHIEIQWRRAKGIPYDWWYATVGHLGSCQEHEKQCHCRNNDTLMVEFNQYSVGSVFRQAMLNKNRNDEQAIEGAGGGYYGGIRKLHDEEEISRWKMLLALASSSNTRGGAPPVAAMAIHFQ